MIERTHGDLTLLHFAGLNAQPGLVHAVTTRPQNYAPHRGVGREEAVRWRRRVCEILGVSFERLTSPEQVMGSDVLRVEEADIGCGRDGRQTAVRFVDGLTCDRPGVPLALMSADCPLICVYDPLRPAIGAVHAGWQGTVHRAAEHLVGRMVEHYGSDPARLRGAVAPSAGACCYEVGEVVRRIAATRCPDGEACMRERDGRLYFDLWETNRRQLLRAGLLPEHLEVAELCTLCDRRFWSHRRDGPDAGRFALFIALR